MQPLIFKIVLFNFRKEDEEMKEGIVTTSKWLKNFKKSVSDLIKENGNSKRTCKCLVLTDGLYQILSDNLGYQPTDFMGYKLEITDRTEEEIEMNTEYMYIDGDNLN